MLGRSPQAVQCFVKEREVVGTGVGIAKGWADDGDLVVWEEGVAEGVFAVAFLMDTPFIDGLGVEYP